MNLSIFVFESMEFPNGVQLRAGKIKCMIMLCVCFRFRGGWGVFPILFLRLVGMENHIYMYANSEPSGKTILILLIMVYP